MVINFAVKVPLLMRVKILFMGGLFVEFDYKGQHKMSDIYVGVISEKGVRDANKN